MAEREGQNLNATHYPQRTQPLTEVTTTIPGPENEPPPGSGVSAVKVGLGCAGLGMMIITGSIILFLIVMPSVFRGLLPGQRASVEGRLPFMTMFEPTKAYMADALPTFAATSAQAIALLESPVASPTPLPVSTSSGDLSAGADNNGGIAVTSVLTTDTPVPPTPEVSAASPTPLVGQTATPLPTPTIPPTDAAVVSVPPTVPPMPLPASFHWEGFKREQQEWNNCGPANMTQVLRYFGWTGTQKDAAHWLKPFSEDKNVSPWQMVQFVKLQEAQLGVRAIYRYAGDLTLLKRLITNHFAVIVEKGFNYDGWMGHYMTIIGYDDSQRLFYGLDTYQNVGPDEIGHTQDYDDLDHVWQQFNRVFIVIFPSNRTGELAALLGPDSDVQYNVQHALSVATSEASARPDNPFAWFNMGTSYTLLGQYDKATYAFDQARSVGGGLPPRMLWYQFGSYEAYFKTGNYQAVIADANTSLVTTTYVEETFYWKGMAEAAQGFKDAAISDFKIALKLNPNFTPAKDAQDQVETGAFKPPVSPKT